MHFITNISKKVYLKKNHPGVSVEMCMKTFIDKVVSMKPS